MVSTHGQMKMLEEKNKDYEEKTISLGEYCQFLLEMADEKGMNLIKDYPNVTAFSEATQLEKEIDFNSAELERNTLIKALASLLSDREVEELIDKSRRFKSGNISSQDYYSFLKFKAGQKLSLAHDYPQLNSYIRYINVSNKIEIENLLKEVNSIGDEVREAFFINSEQRRLSEISQSLNLLRRLFNLELTPEDYKIFQANRSKFLTAYWIDFLSQNRQRYNLSLHPVQSAAIDSNLGKLEEFYRLGMEREKTFIKNSISKMNESGEKLAVLIAGGFHTPGITRMLKENGYSYLVVAPVITERTDSSVYFSALRDENSHIARTLKGE